MNSSLLILNDTFKTVLIVDLLFLYNDRISILKNLRFNVIFIKLGIFYEKVYHDYRVKLMSNM